MRALQDDLNHRFMLNGFAIIDTHQDEVHDATPLVEERSLNRTKFFLESKPHQPDLVHDREVHQFYLSCDRYIMFFIKPTSSCVSFISCLNGPAPKCFRNCYMFKKGWVCGIIKSLQPNCSTNCSCLLFVFRCVRYACNVKV